MGGPASTQNRMLNTSSGSKVAIMSMQPTNGAQQYAMLKPILRYPEAPLSASQTSQTTQPQSQTIQVDNQ